MVLTIQCVANPVDGESAGIFDGTLPGPQLGSVDGTLLGSNDRSNPDIPFGTSEGTEDGINDFLLDGNLDGTLLTVSLVLLMVTYLDLMMVYH